METNYKNNKEDKDNNKDKEDIEDWKVFMEKIGKTPPTICMWC